MRDINFYFRLPIFIFALLSLWLFYFFTKKLLNPTIALFSVIFIGLSPIILGISLLVNPDALLWIFVPLSMLGYFIFQKEQKKKYLLFSGIFLGLALLTKYVANILLVYFLAMIFADYIFSQKEKPALFSYLRKEFFSYILLVLYSTITFFLLFPATWKKPKMLLSATFLSKAFQSSWKIFVGLIIVLVLDNLLFKSKFMKIILDFFTKWKKMIIRAFSASFLAIILFVLINTYSGMKFIDFQSVLSSPKSGTETVLKFAGLGSNVLADFYALIFGLIPIVFLFFIFSLWKNFKNPEKNKEQSNLVFYLSFFILVYYLASSVNGVGATVRYQIILYPMASIIAAIGLYQFLEIEKIKKYSSLFIVYPALIIISVFSLYSIKPFYFSYASDLLPKNYILNLKDMGDGSFEAAQYLNNLPDAQNLSIWSDKGAVCESFVGKCAVNFNKNDIVGQNFDYFVSSTGRKSRSFKMSGGVNQYFDFKGAYTTDNYVYRIDIGGRPNNSIKIVEGKYLKVD